MNIPEITLDAIDLWVNHKLPTGGFLEAVINNDLVGAISKADPMNLVALPLIVTHINSISGVPKFYAGAMREWVNDK